MVKVFDKIKDVYDDYKAKEPERREKRMVKIKNNIAEQKLKNKEEELKKEMRDLKGESGGGGGGFLGKMGLEINPNLGKKSVYDKDHQTNKGMDLLSPTMGGGMFGNQSEQKKGKKRKHKRRKQNKKRNKPTRKEVFYF